MRGSGSSCSTCRQGGSGSCVWGWDGETKRDREILLGYSAEVVRFLFKYIVLENKLIEPVVGFCDRRGLADK